VIQIKKWEDLKDILGRKMVILKKIAANTEIQLRFIPRRELRGLRRILRERDELLDKLADVNMELSYSPGWETIPSLAAKRQEIAMMQQAILTRSSQGVQQAVTERRRIAAELNSSRAARNIKRQYVNHWAGMPQGGRINEKG